jgi:hypothetical protein
MGWITGLLTFGLSAILFAAQEVPAALAGRMNPLLQERLKSMPGQDPVMVAQFMHFLESGPGIAFMLFFLLMALFLFITGLSMAGGAIGAKVVGRS